MKLIVQLECQISLVFQRKISHFYFGCRISLVFQKNCHLILFNAAPSGHPCPALIAPGGCAFSRSLLSLLVHRGASHRGQWCRCVGFATAGTKVFSSLALLGGLLFLAVGCTGPLHISVVDGYGTLLSYSLSSWTSAVGTWFATRGLFLVFPTESPSWSIFLLGCSLLERSSKTSF